MEIKLQHKYNYKYSLVIFITLINCCLSGCGQKGPLYLPDQADQVQYNPGNPHNS